jgi:hypothetical protein
MHGRLYEVWFSRGNGFSTGPRFRFLDDARRYVADHLPEASYAIRDPEGHWEMYKRDVPLRRAVYR